MAGCQKKDETPVQPNKVAFNITSPQQGQAFKKGDSILVKADISYVSQLHGYSVKITDEQTGAVVYNNEDHAHGDQFSINEYWVDTLDNNNKTLKLEIVAVIDHDGNTSEKELEIKHQP